MSTDNILRAGDADRDAVAEILRRHHAEGRIDTDELQERVNRCYEAKTLGELDQLQGDLPKPAPTGQRSMPLFGLRQWWPVPLAPALIALLAITAASGHH